MDCPTGWPLFHEYEDEIRTKNRFFLSPKFERLFLRIVNNKSNISILSPQEPLFRARVNKPDGQFEYVHELRGNKNPMSTNRASPVGIPYTYLAGDVETAIAEIRANIKQEITVAEFHVKDEENILTLDDNTSYGGSIEDDFSSLEIASFIHYLGNAFARPVKDGENRELAYLPCQYFAEFCKKHKLSGIRYHSAARGGIGNKKGKNRKGKNKEYYNYVIFNDDDLVYAEANCYTIARIEYEIENNGKVNLIDDSGN